MKIHFFKYQGTGNDFIMMDNFDGRYDGLSVEMVRQICDRKLGVGADGLIKLSKDQDVDFNVDYYNADGSKSFCGNGARCSVAFAHRLGKINEHTVFSAIDGVHRAEIKEGIVRLEMLPVHAIEKRGDDFELNTGSPHYVHFMVDGEEKDIVEYGKSIRYSPEYAENGINVNLVTLEEGAIRVETYERGVEDETLSCGTGVTACALVQMMNKKLDEGKVKVHTKGGTLLVEGKKEEEGFVNIWLSGPTQMVFDGSIELSI